MTSPLFALTKPGSCHARWLRLSSATRAGAPAGSQGVPPHSRCKIQQLESQRMDLHPAPLNPVLLENGADPSSDRAVVDQYVQLPPVSVPTTRPSPALRRRQCRKKSDPDLSGVAAEKSSAQRSKSRLEFLRCPREFRSDFWICAESARYRNQATV